MQMLFNNKKICHIIIMFPYVMAQPKLATQHQNKLPLYSISIVRLLTTTMDVFINLIHINLVNTVITDTTCSNIILIMVFAMKF